MALAYAWDEMDENKKQANAQVNQRRSAKRAGNKQLGFDVGMLHLRGEFKIAFWVGCLELVFVAS